ncbi:MAG: XrtA/PEP-CTERM system histidine kinase PrsK [Sphingomicrobium sp.]|nr:PEP-CTERM system histidine kinase PrsK [Sphingomonadales bacterium]
MTAAWTYGLAAACFAGLLAWRLRQPFDAPAQRLLLAAYLMTAIWAGVSAVVGVWSPLTVLAGTLRNLAWLSLLFSMTRRRSDEESPPAGLNLVFGAEALVVAIQLTLNLVVLSGSVPSDSLETFTQTSRLLRIVTASGALIIIHNLYGQAAPSSRGSIRLAMFALTLMWGYDLNLFTFAYLGSPLAEQLFVWRGLLIAATMPLLAMSDGRHDGWRIRLSRAATFQSLSLLAICGYFTVMTVVATALRGSGWDGTQYLGAGAIVLISLTAILLISSARVRSWAKVKFAKHFFEHRYDYRTEWLRFTGTIGRSGAHAPPLGERVIKAFADILDAPGGLLLVADESGAIDCAASWNWPGRPLASGDGPVAPDFWRRVESEGRTVDLDAARRGWGASRDRQLGVPSWMTKEPVAWIAVPLIHHERLVGMVLLAAPEYRRSLDWEDFDLLRTAGRQAASSLAEAHGQEALLNAQRFEEFNRRFAFILHDVKNLVSQLSLLSRNAERHADNPEFRADMVATLKGSVGKMNELLARLAPQGGMRSERAEATPLRDLLSSAIAAKRRDHDVRLLGDTGLWAMVDPLGLEQAVGHLLQNAIDASPSGEPVIVRVDGDGAGISIAIADQGIGMDSEFVRHRLFQPFASTKQGGFGVGAFEARSLVAGMGGRLTVTSTPGKGSQFTIHLTAADAAPLRKIA